MLSDPKLPAIMFFLIASVLLAFSTFLWFSMHYFVDKDHYPILSSIEYGFYFAATVTALGALVCIAKGILRQMKMDA